MSSASQKIARIVGQLTHGTLAMFRDIMRKNGVADICDEELSFEIAAFFRFSYVHRIELGRVDDYSQCILDLMNNDDDEDDVSSLSGSHSSMLSSPFQSPSPSSPAPSSIPETSRLPVTDRQHYTSCRNLYYSGMAGPNQKKRKCNPQNTAAENSTAKLPTSEAQTPRAIQDGTSQPISGGFLTMESTIQELASASRAPEPRILEVEPTEDRTDLMTQSLLGGMSEIREPTDAVRIMTSVLLDCTKRRYKAGKFGAKVIPVKTTSNTKSIRSYTEELAKKDFLDAVNWIVKTNAVDIGIGLQKIWEENVYWKIIRKHADILESETLSTTKGPRDGFTQAQKIATSKFVCLARLGASQENQRKYRHFWRILFNLQEAGVQSILHYRTAEFNKYCKEFRTTKEPPKVSLIDTITSWENVYGKHIQQIELRALAECAGDFSGKFDLQQSLVAERLTLEDFSWNNGSNEWYSADEKKAYMIATDIRATSTTKTPELLAGGIGPELGNNKSFFISLIPFESIDSAEKLVAVCPIIPISSGDFVGVFSGKIRFAKREETVQAIVGPAENLWMDYSQVTGKLNQMQVVKPGENANVDLIWEAVNENELGKCQYWRVLVVATRNLLPFEQLIRTAPSQEQYLLHQLTQSARRGFTR